MNCERTPGEAVVMPRSPRSRNTEPLVLLAATSAIRSLKVISLKGPLPRTIGGGGGQHQKQHIPDRLHLHHFYQLCSMKIINVCFDELSFWIEFWGEFKQRV